MQKRLIIALALMLIAGCAQQVNTEQLVMNNPQAQDFLKAYPHAVSTTLLYAKKDAQLVLEDIKRDCNQAAPKNIYRVLLHDKNSSATAVAWIDADAQQVVCVFRKEGRKQAAPPKNITQQLNETAHTTSIANATCLSCNSSVENKTSSTAPEKECTMESELTSCKTFKVSASAKTVQLVLSNNAGEKRGNVSVHLFGCALSTAADGNDAWPDGALLGGSSGITLTSCPGINAVGSNYRETFKILYLNENNASTYTRGVLRTIVES